ncbi:hypothetical protein GCM10023160_19820 [Brachybacterium paraconglomeratum]
MASRQKLGNDPVDLLVERTEQRVLWSRLFGDAYFPCPASRSDRDVNEKLIEHYAVAMEEVNTWRIIAPTDAQQCASTASSEGPTAIPHSPRVR